MARVLSISYDESLLRTRQWMLERCGYKVTSALGYAEALDACKEGNQFDLIIMGHSMPQEDKTALITTLRQHSPAPLLALKRHNEQPMKEAQFSIDVFDGPEVFLDAVKSALNGSP